MSQNASGQITRDSWVEESDVPGTTLQQRSEVILLSDEASNAIVQCLIIAARRGRQIRLARAQLETQQSESGAVRTETSLSSDM